VSDTAVPFKVTYVGGPTALIEIGGLRLLTDPVFDPPGGKYRFGLGTGSVKLDAPALAPAELGRIDAVLLSHDHHADNLDPAGRALLPSAGQVLTTASGAGRLGGNALGLEPWATTTLRSEDGLEVRVTATPCRHGPPLSHPLVGDVVGFMLEWDGQRDGAFWMSGDTVYYRGVAEVGRRFDVGTALIHIGGVRFAISGPARYTMNAAEAARVADELGLKTLLPIHYEGWKHFRENRAAAEQAFAAAGVSDRVRWLTAGRAEEISV
jgi:L-ascorbate metabolism protein UlaG (beta-lactamase superfamily)